MAPLNNELRQVSLLVSCQYRDSMTYRSYLVMWSFSSALASSLFP